MSRVVLFGAGASYGSGAVIPQPPPLGKTLFSTLRHLYASWRAIPENEARLFESNFEEGMEKIIVHYGMAVAPLMQDMGIFFSIFSLSPGASNLYSSIFRDLRDPEKIIWSTLNYECLLEFGVVTNGKSVGYFSDVSADGTLIPVWKLHGSCNFKLSGLQAGRGISFGTGVVFDGDIEVIEPSQVRGHFKGNTALYPAMALFAKNKPVAIAPRPIQEAQSRWKAHVLAARKVAIIGVRPNPDDKHLWDSLGSCPGEVALVCSEDEFSAWKKTYRPALPTKWLGARWNEAYPSLVEFLASIDS